MSTNVVYFPQKTTLPVYERTPQVSLELVKKELVAPEVMSYVKARVKARQILVRLSVESLSNSGLTAQRLEVSEYSENQLVGWILSASSTSVAVNPNFYRACCLELEVRLPS